MALRLRLRVAWRSLKYSSRTPDRKQVLTFGLVATPVGLYWQFGNHWAIALLTAGIGTLLSTDYTVIDEYISSRLYNWVQNTETLLEAVEQNQYAAQYAAQNHEPFELTYWKNGHFRATVPSGREIQSGMQFLIQCEVTSKDREITYRTPFCTAEVESVSAESDGKCEVKLNLVRWLDEAHTGNELDREVYRKKSKKLRTDDDDISPTAIIDESGEMSSLTPTEWKKVAELLDKAEVREMT